MEEPNALSKNAVVQSKPKTKKLNLVLCSFNPYHKSSTENIPAKPLGIVQEIADWVRGDNASSKALR